MPTPGTVLTRLGANPLHNPRRFSFTKKKQGVSNRKSSFEIII